MKKHDVQRSSTPQSEVIREIVRGFRGAFEVKDVVKALGERHNGRNIVSAYLCRAAYKGEVKVVERGQGRRPTLYRHNG